MNEQLLPGPFEDLSRFAEAWALPTESARTRQRIESSMEEVRAFYDAMLPRLDAAFSYLNAMSLNELPPDARRLFLMTLSLVEAAIAVEVFGRPTMELGLAHARFVPLHDKAPRRRRLEVMRASR